MTRCVNGAIEVKTEAGTFYPSADEIFRVVFEGERQIRGVNLSSESFSQLGLTYSQFAAEPVIEFSMAENRLSPEIQVHLKARENSIVLPVPIRAGQILDYGCDNKMWMPLAPGATELFQEVLPNLRPNGTIGLKDYLAATQGATSSIAIIDTVPQVLMASGAFPAPDVPIPAAFVGTLYPYQQSGFRWLAYMASEGVPGCLLADEMGLGKTVQIICAFLACKSSDIGEPALIIAPATLLENWRREFAKFSPCTKVQIHKGPERAGLAATLRVYDAVVVSYETLVSDISLFREITWGLLILDEAQAIKNPAARRRQAVVTLSRKAAIAVTGTPVENRLTDLWSIADFLLPGRLGTLAEFERDFPETRDGAVALEPRVSPFILRRRVAEVATDLPPRIEIPQAIQLDDRSAQEYDRIRQSVDPNSSGAALAVLQKLRMFCAHPWLVDTLMDEQDASKCSNKVLRIHEILEEVFSWSEKVLIFTSFQQMSDIITQSIRRKFDVPVWQIDGRTTVGERQPLVDRFSTTSQSAVLLLNPKAAGTGLNIVAANHVIHYNLEWNPAMEDQASARAFRRGQQRPVTIHRLFYSSTVEEFIDSRSAMKRELAERSVIGSDGQGLHADDIVRALTMTPISHERSR